MLGQEGKRGILELAAGPSGSGAPVSIQQDARMYVARLDAGTQVPYDLAHGRGAWLQIARGAVALNGAEMKEGDGAAIESETHFGIAGISAAEVLLFDLA
jgi:redox-sensitive bicupin YhaK (pirin superfamily)